MERFTRALARLVLLLALGLLAALLVAGSALLLWPETVLTLALRTLGAMALTAAALLLGGLLCRR
ncbi:MAG TPA: hypothetical protein IAA53_04905 [Candidatus Avoscillospira avicola]|uniref:Uncharacterized protein n=1 Tax=Candidatus Avoscillospira avicola TaxID=2840706 RepID=A0A9D1DHC4_9FIRM|nr:hypothetical protein [Candidatus Avoscillospira avicola]